MENGYFALTMYSFEQGQFVGTSANFFHAFRALIDPSQIIPLDIYLYNNVTQPIITYILAIIIFRLILNIIAVVLTTRDTFHLAAFSSFLISIFFLLGIINRPLQAQNGLDLIRLWSIIIGFVLFLVLGITFSILKSKKVTVSIRYNSRLQKGAIVMAIGMVFLILIPVFISIPKSISLSDPTIYEELEWNIKYARQIDWTRQAAGITIGDTNYFQIQDILEYPDNVTVPDNAITNVIRQYDKTISGKNMLKNIKTTYEAMADSDIIYVPSGVGQGEYWVAPKTLDVSVLTSDVNKHTELYDHVEGFIALDTSTGEMVKNENYEAIFGVEARYPIFFGEKEETSSSSSSTDLTLSTIEAFESDILLNTGWESNLSVKYEGAPDGSLNGFEGFWYTIRMGLTKFALDSNFEKQFLINRNIRTRVESVLMPGLIIDEDPYLVFNKNESKMYYALSIYTDIAIGAYADSHLYRFLGVALVDVKDGTLSWFKNPGLPNYLYPSAPFYDPLSPIWKIYLDNQNYPWENTPAWLKPQLHYPETLWESQLAVDYIYHVTDLTSWKKQNDFYKRPSTSDAFYIETDLGEGIEFAGVDVVEYVGEGAQKLAGLYVIRHGNNFGKTIFYRTNVSRDNLIGPQTAEDTFANVATQQISLINDPRYGNRLLYPLAGSLYYFIPVYSQTGGLEDLALAALVNAFDQATYYGVDINAAYLELAKAIAENDTTPVNETTDLRLQILSGAEDVIYSADNWAEFRVLIDYQNTTDSLIPRNLMLNLSIASDVNMTVKVNNINLTGMPFSFASGTAYNYTIRSWVNVYPGDFVGVTAKINLAQPLIGAAVVILYRFNLIDVDTQEIVTTGWLDLGFFKS